MEPVKYYIRGLLKKMSYFFSDERVELKRIKKIPGHKKGSTTIFGFDFTFVDSVSFLSQYSEIFIKQILNFETKNKQPYIIDCGSNVGISILYFKKTYPNAEIIGFEPDKNIFSTLKENIANSKLSNIFLLNKGLWNKGGKIYFNEEGADGGRILKKISSPPINTKTVEIDITSLKQYLNKTVDFLKIDIEGAESVVLEDCKGLLNNVQRIFIEFHSKVDEEQNLGSILNILTTNGFRYYIESGSIFSFQPFIKRRLLNNYDNLLSVFAYRDHTSIRKN
jgi:FkbM family methyltransferase